MSYDLRHPGLIQLFWQTYAFGAVCEIDNGGDVLIVEYVVDREVLEILPGNIA